MTLTDRHRDIYAAKICPYCGSGTKVVDEEFIYGRSYSGRSVVCCNNYPSCNAYVGSHDDGKPLGRLANKQLREWKSKAHSVFDPIWQKGIMKRNEAYEWLSEQLGIEKEYTHIDYFNVKTCKKVVEICLNFNLN